MDQSGIHIGDVGKILRRVVDDWRLDERSKVRRQLADFEDRLDRLDGVEGQEPTEERREQLQTSLDQYNSRLGDKHAMIDEAHRQMVDYLEQAKRVA